MHTSRFRGGFTLVELVIVIAIAGLMIAIAMPQVNTPERRLDGAVREAWSTVTAARQQAVLLQHDVLLDFDTTEQTITVTQDADNDGVRDAGEPYTVQAFEEISLGRGSAPVGAVGAASVTFEVPSGGARPRLVFHRNGSASEFGGFYLRTERAASPPWSDEVRLVTIERATGRVSSFRQDGSGWEARY